MCVLGSKFHFKNCLQGLLKEVGIAARVAVSTRTRSRKVVLLPPGVRPEPPPKWSLKPSSLLQSMTSFIMPFHTSTPSRTKTPRDRIPIPPLAKIPERLPLPFLELPREIRDHIYTDILAGSSNAVTLSPWSIEVARSLSILRTCKQIQRECKDIIWQHNGLRLREPTQLFTRFNGLLKVDDVRRIEHIELTLELLDRGELEWMCGGLKAFADPKTLKSITLLAINDRPRGIKEYEEELDLMCSGDLVDGRLFGGGPDDAGSSLILKTSWPHFSHWGKQRWLREMLLDRSDTTDLLQKLHMIFGGKLFVDGELYPAVRRLNWPSHQTHFQETNTLRQQIETMARIKEVSGLEVEIVVDRKPSIPGREFAILTRLASPFEIAYTAISFKVQVNSVKVMGTKFTKKRYEEKKLFKERVIEGVKEGGVDGVVLRSFKFREPLENYNNDNATLNTPAIGKIIVHAWEAKIKGVVDAVPEQGLIKSEGISHGDPMLAKETVVYSIKNVGTKPIASFVFEYSSDPLPLLKRNKLYSIPLFTPGGSEGPSTPESSGRKREREIVALNEETPAKRRQIPSTNIAQNKKDQESIEDEHNYHIASMLMGSNTKNNIRALIEDDNDNDDSSSTMPASSPPLRIAKIATPAKTATTAKSTPQKAIPAIPQTPKKTPVSGLKLKPRNTPQKRATETIDLTGDSD
ncbi:hypothetical protein HYALB_00003610 [Hymenoscyphus albidus]|uniref:Uncharacterized protein n=1 Tax=Hymenoscyphus albidus TaxID=595503 RepID=A0A9N9LW00_9HELO|nr:hypothetical protein HYALB_00003610 [Hymenoscyphus albidus]